MYNNYNTNAEACQEVLAKHTPERRKSYVNSQMSPEWIAVSESVESTLVKRLTYYKWRNVKISACLRNIGEASRANAINDCGTFVSVGKRNGHDVFGRANFCRQRLCQVCGWRRSSKFVAQMIPVCNLLATKGYKFVFVTLTVPNMPSDEVNEAITNMLKAWDRLTKRAAYKRNWHGYARSIEVTYNATEKTYHPHIHILVACKHDYFNKVSSYPIQTGKNRKMNEIELKISADWRSALRRYDDLPYPLQVSIIPANRAKRSGDDVSVAAAVETLKYSYKISSKAVSNETIATLLYSLQDRRLVSFGGVIAEARLQLQQGDIDDDLTDEPDPGEGSKHEVLYLFNMNGWRVIDDCNMEGD